MELCLTCELREQAPAAMAVGLDVVDEELVLLRRPGPLLEALGLVAARRPPHRPPPAAQPLALRRALSPPGAAPPQHRRARALKLTRCDCDAKRERSRGAHRHFCLVMSVMCVRRQVRRGEQKWARMTRRVLFATEPRRIPGARFNGGDFHLLPATRRRSRAVAYSSGGRESREPGPQFSGSSGFAYRTRAVRPWRYAMPCAALLDMALLAGLKFEDAGRGSFVSSTKPAGGGASSLLQAISRYHQYRHHFCLH